MSRALTIASATLGCLALSGCRTVVEDPSRPYEHLAAYRTIEQLELVRHSDWASHRATLLEHESPHIRARAARAMGRVWSGAVVPELLQMATTDEPSDSVLYEVAFALGQLHALEAQPVLADLLEHESVTVRAAAVQALGKLRAADGSVDPEFDRRGLIIAGALHDEDAAVRGLAALALFWHQADPAGRPMTAESVASARSASVVSIATTLMNERDPEARWRMVYALDRIEDPGTTPVLLPLVHDPHPWVRAFAAEGLSRPGLADSVEPLIWVLGDLGSHWTARVNALRSLGRLRRESIGDADRIREALVGRLHQESHPLVKEIAIDTLAEFGGELEAQLLLAVLEKPNVSLTERRAALRGLGRCGKEGAASHLMARASDPEPLIRTAVAKGLGHVGVSAMPTLLTLLEDGDVRVRTAALDAIASLPTEEKWDYVRRCSTDDDLAIRGSAVTAIITGKPPRWRETIQRVYANSSENLYWETRNTILDALAADGSEDAMAIVRAALSDNHYGVRLRAQTLLPNEAVGTTEQFIQRPYPRLDPWSMVGRENPRLTLDTTRGTIVIELFLRDAPEHVSHVVNLARQGVYDGLPFHRVVPAFVVQGGDPRGDGWGDNGTNLPHEINPHPYERGTVGMPTAGPDTGGCQIFIDHLPTPHLDGRYTVYGRVRLGMEVVDLIEVGDRIIEATVDENQFWGMEE